MHITVLGLGSRGDVQPYIALAHGLRRAGHQVRVVTHEEFRPLVEGRDLEFAEVHGNPRDMLCAERAHTMLESGENAARFLLHFSKLMEPFVAQIVADCCRACEGTDAVVLCNVGMISGFNQIAEYFNVPYCTGLLQPVTPTSEFPSAFVPPLPAWMPMRAAYNRLSHRAFLRLFRRVFGSVMPMIRRQLGLPPLSGSEIIGREAADTSPILYAYSPSVIPRPSDWPPHIHVTGYWFLDDIEDWQPPSELVDFLSAGPPPVYVGFGSMRNRNPQATAEIVLEALKRTGRRGILLTGSGLSREELPDYVFPLESTSHNWLLPRCSAVIHHGGAGTTAAGLRSGQPSIVVPFFADQPFWARKVHELSVGPRPIPRKRLTVERLERAINETLRNAEMRERAARLGERITAEDGVGSAVKLFPLPLKT